MLFKLNPNNESWECFNVKSKSRISKRFFYYVCNEYENKFEKLDEQWKTLCSFKLAPIDKYVNFEIATEHPIPENIKKKLNNFYGNICALKSHNLNFCRNPNFDYNACRLPKKYFKDMDGYVDWNLANKEINLIPLCKKCHHCCTSKNKIERGKIFDDIMESYKILNLYDKFNDYLMEVSKELSINKLKEIYLSD